jgi:murein DD-endopeptidase MepM/ murein hydrolase activator NlpD
VKRGILLATLLALLVPGGAAAADLRVIFPESTTQGSMVIGKVPAGSVVHYAGRSLRVSAYGTVAFGVGRDEAGPLHVEVLRADGSTIASEIQVAPRDWPVEHVDGVPPKTVDPPPEIAERIRREQAAVAAVRDRDDDRTDFTESFMRPVAGRISGRFGNQRVYNGKPRAAHSGMDIAAPGGTPVKGPGQWPVTRRCRSVPDRRHRRDRPRLRLQQQFPAPLAP